MFSLLLLYERTRYLSGYWMSLRCSDLSVVVAWCHQMLWTRRSRWIGWCDWWDTRARQNEIRLRFDNFNLTSSVSLLNQLSGAHRLDHRDLRCIRIPPTMTRGNQRDKAREKNLKAQGGEVSLTAQHFVFNSAFNFNYQWIRLWLTWLAQKKKNNQSGTEFQRTKEAQAAIMREKQAKGWLIRSAAIMLLVRLLTLDHSCCSERRWWWYEKVTFNLSHSGLRMNFRGAVWLGFFLHLGWKDILAEACRTSACTTMTAPQDGLFRSNGYSGWGFGLRYYTWQEFQ